ncbi:hypothetical protein T12_14079 [Trichinella patagoniensis]|uniref:Uncharacterized protein n=1 Tax=Trichinella patagoniensis TaxID=990121 RepID=A0A0V0ZXF0_9BILA|nr:hypothetical protein T12_14079 [Trichinella patagoniensis]
MPGVSHWCRVCFHRRNPSSRRRVSPAPVPAGPPPSNSSPPTPHGRTVQQRRDESAGVSRWSASRSRRQGRASFANIGSDKLRTVAARPCPRNGEPAVACRSPSCRWSNKDHQDRRHHHAQRWDSRWSTSASLFNVVDQAKISFINNGSLNTQPTINNQQQVIHNGTLKRKKKNHRV